ncbi:MAG: hypothetical protein ABSF91_15420 [Bacteroidota bacterium]
MKTCVCALLVVLFILSGCAKQSSKTNAVPLTAEAQRILNAMADSIRINGLTGWTPFLHNSPQFSWEFNGVHTSYDSLIAGEQREAPLYRSITLKWDSVNAESVGENAMHLTARFSEALVKNDGSEATITGGVDCQLERIDGAWKFTRGKTFDH